MKVYAVLLLIVGLAVGYFAYPALNKELNKERGIKVPSLTLPPSQESLNLANSIGYANFWGGWISISDEDLVNKVNAVDIGCWRDKKTCEMAQANLIDGDLMNKISYYDIESWSADGQITAVSSSLCENQILKADIRNNVVTLTESSLSTTDDLLCKSHAPQVIKLGPIGYPYLK